MNSLKGITLLQNYFGEKKEIAEYNQAFGIKKGIPSTAEFDQYRDLPGLHPEVLG
jgi:hypothetical protein